MKAASRKYAWNLTASRVRANFAKTCCHDRALYTRRHGGLAMIVLSSPDVYAMEVEGLGV